MGFGHRVYRAEDPRAARAARPPASGSARPRYEVAAALEKAALDELHARRPDRVLATNVEFWAAVLLDFAEVPGDDVHPDVHLRPHRRLVGAHPRAEADRPADPARARATSAPARGPSRPSRAGAVRPALEADVEEARAGRLRGGLGSLLACSLLIAVFDVFVLGLAIAFGPSGFGGDRTMSGR